MKAMTDFPHDDREDYDDYARRHVSLKRVWALFRPYRGKLAFVALLILVAATLGAATPFLVRAIVDEAIPQGDLRLLLLLTGGMVALAAIAAGTSVLQVLMTTRIGQQIMHDLRVRVYGHLQSLSLRFYATTRTGEIQSRISNDIGGMQALVTNTVVDVARNFGLAIATAVAMLLLDWRMTLLSFLIIPLTIWLNRRIADRRERLTYEQQAKMADMSSVVQETLSAQGVVLGRTMGRTRHLIARFTRTSEAVSALEVRAHTAGQGEWALIYFVLDVMPALTFLLGGVMMFGDWGLTLGTLVALIALQEQLMWPLLELLDANVEVRKARSLFARVFEYLDAEADVTESAAPLSLSRSDMKGSVRFENVRFSYGGDAPPAIRGVDLSIAAGERVAIVGRTGSGKSTLAYLLTRLYDVDEGGVLIDGHDVRDLSLDTLSTMVGIVTQDIYMFHGTIAENLRFARPDATDEDLIRAAQVAGVHEDVMALPEGYQAMVGERGQRFSGGQRQRLAIARIVLRDPPVLVLDEATSALDNTTEAEVTAQLDHVMRERTTIMIAHRLSTVRKADRIVVLEQGRIVEQGGYQQLIDQGGAFAELVRSTLG